MSSAREGFDALTRESATATRNHADDFSPPASFLSTFIWDLEVVSDILVWNWTKGLSLDSYLRNFGCMRMSDCECVC